jgi:periplasmic divalent cation tolerance protein
MILARIAMTTVPQRDTALTIARTLVEERLVACVNISSAVESIYWWQGKIEQSTEYVLMMKTTAGQLNLLRDRLLALHPYDVPEFVVLPVESGSEAYLAWITETVGPTS